MQNMVYTLITSRFSGRANSLGPVNSSVYPFVCVYSSGLAVNISDKFEGQGHSSKVKVCVKVMMKS